MKYKYHQVGISIRSQRGLLLILELYAMEIWATAIFTVYFFTQGQSYRVIDTSIEKLATATPKTFQNSSDNAAIEVKDKKVFKPSKQLFSNILLPTENTETSQRYNRIYEQTHIITPAFETQRDQTEKSMEHHFRFPKVIMTNSDGKNHENLEIPFLPEKGISYEPAPYEDQLDTQIIATYDDTIPYSTEKQHMKAGSNHQKRKEIHYHQHKHLHEHEHKQDHLHKHRQEHLHDHDHSHQDNNKHNHYHQGHHEHQHIGQHFHTHEGEHHHEHQSSHQHDHQQAHEHNHWHQQKHEHHGRHSHEHNHNAEHSHDHHSNHGHNHKHAHEHNDKHRHSHQNEDKHHHHDEHEGQHHHKHRSQHDTKHKPVHQNIYMKKYHN